MNEINIIVPEGYVIDEENTSFTCIKFKKEEKKELPKSWEELEEISGYYVSGASSEINKYKTITTSINRNIFATKEQAEASIALAMLSQLMKDVNGDWIPNWLDDDTSKYVISFSGNTIRTDSYTNCTFFLAFPSIKIRDTFLKQHKELIMKAKPLL